MNTAEKSQSALDFFKAAKETVLYLAMRWQDESQFEDINDYKTPLIELAIKHGVTIEKMTKRPFGCVFVTDGKRFQLKCTSRVYSYVRIA